MAAATYNLVQLFGGAISCLLPATFTDVSAIRQVPDNQEVYIDSQGFTSIVFDILERVRVELDEEALQIHLKEVVDEDVTSLVMATSERMDCRLLPPGTPVSTITATTPPAARQQGRANEPDFVNLIMILVRLEKQKTDLVITINVPYIPGHYDQIAVTPGTFRNGPLMERALEMRHRVMESLEIKNWDLFVQE